MKNIFEHILLIVNFVLFYFKVNESVQFSDDPYKVSLQVLKLGLMSNDFISHCLSIPHTNERLKAQLDYLETHVSEWCFNNIKFELISFVHYCSFCPLL